MPIPFFFEYLVTVTDSYTSGFKDFFFSPLLGEMIQFDEHIFQMGGEKPPTSTATKYWQDITVTPPKLGSSSQILLTFPEAILPQAVSTVFKAEKLRKKISLGNFSAIFLGGEVFFFKRIQEKTGKFQW